MEIREQSDARFAHMSDEELRAAASDPNLPAKQLPALKAELRSRNASASANHQPWQQTSATPVVHLPPTMRVVVTDVHMSFASMVVFMVKWTLASIPALIILLVFALAVILVANVIAGR